jgi:hypothetical protein
MNRTFLATASCSLAAAPTAPVRVTTAWLFFTQASRLRHSWQAATAWILPHADHLPVGLLVPVPVTWPAPPGSCTERAGTACQHRAASSACRSATDRKRAGLACSVRRVSFGCARGAWMLWGRLGTVDAAADAPGMGVLAAGMLARAVPYAVACLSRGFMPGHTAFDDAGLAAAGAGWSQWCRRGQESVLGGG